MKYLSNLVWLSTWAQHEVTCLLQSIQDKHQFHLSGLIFESSIAISDLCNSGYSIPNYLPFKVYGGHICVLTPELETILSMYCPLNLEAFNSYSLFFCPQ